MTSHRNAYRVLHIFTALTSVSGFLFPLVALFPSHANAFWPFSSEAASAASPAPILHDPSIGLLTAASNQDPDPIKASNAVAVTSGSALLADSGPAGTLADVASSTPSSDQISIYVVRAGDTLSDIARMFNVSTNTIVWANSLGSTRAIHPGQTLLILPVSGVEHVVVKGDTLKSIAKKYGGDANEIAEYNDIDSSSPLALGTTVIVPGGEIVTAPSAPSSSGKSPVPGLPAKYYRPYIGGSGPELAGYFVNPLPGAVFTQNLHGRNGVDLAAPKGTPIHAAAAGTVIVSRNSGWNGGYGNYVVISHPNGVQTLYAHMTRAVATPGGSVSAGEVIGYVGATGLATGPHTHFEVRGAKNPFAHCALNSVCSPQ